MILRFMRRLAFVTAIFVTLVSFCMTARAQTMLPPGQGFRPTPPEVVQLPKFCWGKWTNYKGPEYEISRKLCGVGTNHYCPALVELLRANRSFGNTKARRGYLGAARQGTLYTLKAIEGYPNCPIRGHAEGTLHLVDPLWRAAGGK